VEGKPHFKICFPHRKKRPLNAHISKELEASNSMIHAKTVWDI
jgi:hypothetical protein